MIVFEIDDSKLKNKNEKIEIGVVEIGPISDTDFKKLCKRLIK